MKKISQYLLLIVLFILTGCNERELTFDRTYPNLAKVDEFREKRQLEIEEEIKNAPNSIRETRPKPRNLLIWEPIENTGKYADVSQYCWDYNYLDCDERMKPQHPYDILYPYYHLPSLTLGTKKTVEVTIDKTRGAILPYPTRVEVYLYDFGKNLHLYHTTDKTEEVKGFNITLPSETGANMFLFKAIYEGEVEGISYHPLLVITK